MERMDSNLEVTFQRLHGAFCEANDRQIIVDERLARAGDLLGKDFHFVAHEMLHWLRRQKEEMSYFGDPEEVEGFVTGIAYSLSEMGNDPRADQVILHRFLPLIQINIKDDNTAKQFLAKLTSDARKLLTEIGR
jgi:hypothetical protein